MHLETASNLYGTTVNPFNRQLTAGGSSGGEGALIGLRGSCLGIGSDIGGSRYYDSNSIASTTHLSQVSAHQRLTMGCSVLDRPHTEYLAAV